MAKGSIGAHRFSIMSATVAALSLGWAPSQAFALDVPIDPTPVTTAVTPVVNAVTSTTSESGRHRLEHGLQHRSEPCRHRLEHGPEHRPTRSTPSRTRFRTPSDTVSNTVSGATDPVSNTASGAVGTVSNTASGAVGTVRRRAGGTVKTANGATTTAGTIAGVGAAETSSTPQAGQLSAMAGWSPRLPSGTYDVNRIGDEGHAACVAGVGTACQSLEGTGGSWTRAVADIIRKLLALTGMSALALFVLACGLTLAGAVALYQSRIAPSPGPLDIPSTSMRPSGSSLVPDHPAREPLL